MDKGHGCTRRHATPRLRCDKHRCEPRNTPLRLGEDLFCRRPFKEPVGVEHERLAWLKAHAGCVEVLIFEKPKRNAAIFNLFRARR